MERLELCIVSVSAIDYHLQSHGPLEHVVSQISTNLRELLECLRVMLREWQDYLNHSHARSPYSYHAPVLRSSLPGRPKFEISKD